MASKTAKTKAVIEQVLKTKDQVEHSFKKNVYREAQFKKDKLFLMDKQLDAAKMYSNASSAGDDTENNRQSSRPTSPSARSASGMGRLATSSGRDRNVVGGRLSPVSAGPASRPQSASTGDLHSSFGFSDFWDQLRPPSTACSRHNASYPRALHPVPHPGRIKNISDKIMDLPFDFRAQQRENAAEVSGVVTAGRSCSKSSNIELARSSSSLSLGGNVSEMDDLENRLDAMNAENERLRANKQQHDYPPDMIDRLGQLIQLFGSRYKAVDKTMIWTKAEEGNKSSFQRWLQHQRSIGAIPLDPLEEVKWDNQSKLEALGPDTDGPARRDWLKVRRRQRAARESALEAFNALNATRE